MIGVVLAGGASRRFEGRPKGLISLNGRPMVSHVGDMLATFCSRVVIEARSRDGYEELGLPLIDAGYEGKGPLAGLAAGLAAGFALKSGKVAFAPCDMPLLTADVYTALISVGGIGAYARTAAGVEPLVAVLGVGARAALVSVLDGVDVPRTHLVLDAVGATPVLFEDQRTFTNVNTRADLERLR
jgi:molybdopterin-guanine dinucleotide biosynthesis protein A